MYRNKRNKSSMWQRSKETIIQSFVGLSLLILLFFLFKSKIQNYLGLKFPSLFRQELLDSDNAYRHLRILERHANYILGLDVSEFQGKIKWQKVDTIYEKYPLHFVFIRSTAGSNKKDRKYDYNWEEAKKAGLIRGAYHYYRPNENSIEQADFFIQTVKLSAGDLPPVLDIEKLPRNQSIASLKVGLHRWLDKVENHYGLRPIIYTGEKYYFDFLKDEFADYPFWIANYNDYRETMQEDWLFWQFTEKARVPGISENKSDINIFNGNLQLLKNLTKED